MRCRKIMGFSPAAAVEDADVLFFWFCSIPSFIAVASPRTGNAGSGRHGLPTWLAEDAGVRRREAFARSATFSAPRFCALDALGLTHSAAPRPDRGAPPARLGRAWPAMTMRAP